MDKLKKSYIDKQTEELIKLSNKTGDKYSEIISSPKSKEPWWKPWSWKKVSALATCLLVIIISIIAYFIYSSNINKSNKDLVLIINSRNEILEYLRGGELTSSKIDINTICSDQKDIWMAWHYRDKRPIIDNKKFKEKIEKKLSNIKEIDILVYNLEQNISEEIFNGKFSYNIKIPKHTNIIKTVNYGGYYNFNILKIINNNNKTVSKVLCEKINIFLEKSNQKYSREKIRLEFRPRYNEIRRSLSQ